MNVKWIKCQGRRILSLEHRQLRARALNGLEGVYIIWHGGLTPTTVFVGHGAIRERLAFHRSDPAVQVFSNLGLFTTWAAISAAGANRRSAFLMNQLKLKYPGKPSALFQRRSIFLGETSPPATARFPRATIAANRARRIPKVHGHQRIASRYRGTWRHCWGWQPLSRTDPNHWNAGRATAGHELAACLLDHASPPSLE